MINSMIAVDAASPKAKDPVGERHLKGLRALKEEKLLEHHVAVTLEPRRRTVDGITLVPWREFLEQLWDGAYV
jgi:uncharacterized protein